jgi:hypothetical protein
MTQITIYCTTLRKTWGCNMTKAISSKALHFPVTIKQLSDIFAIDFTAAELRLYFYLSTVDPFGDTGAKYSAEAAMLFCKIKRSTYFVAKAKFIALGLFEFIDSVTKVRNLNGIRVRSQVLDSQTEIEAKVQPQDADSQTEIASAAQSEVSDAQSEVSDAQSEVSDAQPLKALLALSFEGLQTLSNFNQTLSDAPNQKIAGDEIEYSCSEIEEVKHFDLEVEGSSNQMDLHGKLDLDPISQDSDLDLKTDEFKKTEHLESNQDRNLDLTSKDQNQDLKTDRIGQSFDQESQKQETKAKVQDQQTNTTNSFTPIQTQEDPIQVPPPPALPKISFLDWVKRNKAQHARIPNAYALACIQRDDGSLRAEYEKWLADQENPVYSTYVPETVVLPPKEERGHIVDKAREFLRSRGLRV